jgi:hypothetical protein
MDFNSMDSRMRDKTNVDMVQRDDADDGRRVGDGRLER